jgi:hypothetical protein
LDGLSRVHDEAGLRERRELLLVTILVAVTGAWIAYLLWQVNVSPAADFETYDRGGRFLYSAGNPYAANAGIFFEHHYRYPPLLAMVMPVLRYVWFPLCVAAWAYVLWMRWRAARWVGMLLPLLLVGVLVQQAVVGNASAMMVAALIAVPVHRRAGAVGLAMVSWLKIYPVLGVLWYVGRKDWEALRWFAVTFMVLGLLQTPWLAEFVRYSLSDAAWVSAQYSLRALGPAVWIGATAVLASVTILKAGSQMGWFYALITMLAAIPRLNVLVLVPLLAYAPPLSGARDAHVQHRVDEAPL